MKPCAAAAKAAAALEPLCDVFAGRTTLVFAPGPSLPKLWQGRRSDLPKIAINDAWRIVPDADVLYASDAKWWVHHEGVPDFRGGLKVSYGASSFADIVCVQGSTKGIRGLDPALGYICHGSNSGYAAVHLAAQLGGNPIVLVGFDMRAIDGKEHFFGSHPSRIRVTPNYSGWCENFRGFRTVLAEAGIELLNATPGSALTAVPPVRIEDVLGERAAA